MEHLSAWFRVLASDALSYTPPEWSHREEFWEQFNAAEERIDRAEADAAEGRAAYVAQHPSELARKGGSEPGWKVVGDAEDGHEEEQQPDDRVYTLPVCSTCEDELDGRTCVNGHSSYPAKKIEVVKKSALTSEQHWHRLTARHLLKWIRLNANGWKGPPCLNPDCEFPAGHEADFPCGKDEEGVETDAGHGVDASPPDSERS